MPLEEHRPGPKTPLAAVVCGFERGGTTVLGQLLRQHPELDAPFEGGFLLARRPRLFPELEPYAPNLRRSLELDEATLREVCDTDDWLEVYRRLSNTSPVLRRPGIALFDKTPRYLSKLPEVLEKVPGVPCIVLARDPVAVLLSWRKRAPMQPKRWAQEQLVPQCERYVRYYRGYVRALDEGFGDRVLLVHYEALCRHPEREAERIFAHLGLAFDPAFLAFPDRARMPANFRGEAISDAFIDGYVEGVPEPVLAHIRRETEEASAFRWRDGP